MKEPIFDATPLSDQTKLRLNEINKIRDYYGIAKSSNKRKYWKYKK